MRSQQQEDRALLALRVLHRTQCDYFQKLARLSYFQNCCCYIRFFLVQLFYIFEENGRMEVSLNESLLELDNLGAKQMLERK